MKRLVTALLALPFLLGACTPPVLPRDIATAGTASLRVDFLDNARQPQLAGQLNAAALTPSTAPAEPGAADSWRTPTRTQHTHSDPLHHGAHAFARTHIARVRLAVLAYSRLLARARSNEPLTLGNPPPHSPA